MMCFVLVNMSDRNGCVVDGYVKVYFMFIVEYVVYVFVENFVD